jgi:DMSO reductase anchor subunit
MFFLVASQFCAGALFLKQWRQVKKPTARSPLRIEMWKAAALIAVGGLPAVFGLAKSALEYAAKHR